MTLGQDERVIEDERLYMLSSSYYSNMWRMLAMKCVLVMIKYLNPQWNVTCEDIKETVKFNKACNISESVRKSLKFLQNPKGSIIHEQQWL